MWRSVPHYSVGRFLRDMVKHFGKTQLCPKVLEHHRCRSLGFDVL